MAETAAVEKVEAAKNCAGCNKVLKRKKKYYRNGKYYCNKNCFKSKKPEEGKEEVKKEGKAASS